MLKKLFAHEWKDTWRLVGLMNLIVIGLTIIGSVFLSNKTLKNAVGENEMLAVAAVLYLVFYIVSVFALSFIVSIYFYIRFYKNLYTDQGYLMHTLPVSSHALIWSKTLVAVIWSVISIFVIWIAVFSLMFAAMSPSDRTEFIQDITYAFQSVEWDARIIVIILEFVVMMAVSMLMSVFMGYAAISIGQLFKKQKVLGAVGIYIGLYMLIQTIMSYSSMFLTMAESGRFSDVDPLNAMMLMLLILLIVAGAFATGFYFITHYIMENQLNLE